MSMTQMQQLHELSHKAGLVNGKKTPESAKKLKAKVSQPSELKNDRIKPLTTVQVTVA